MTPTLASAVTQLKHRDTIFQAISLANGCRHTPHLRLLTAKGVCLTHLSNSKLSRCLCTVAHVTLQCFWVRIRRQDAKAVDMRE